MTELNDTIIAPATAPSESGVAIVRMSGPHAADVLRRLFRPSRRGCRWSSHRLYFGTIVDPSTGGSIDQGLAVLMRAPRSYTGEDVAELHSHGSPQVVQRILTLAGHEGVRLAHPGEFTQRAVLNGRMDLAQAEAVLETITARSERALLQATHGLSGEFSRRVRMERDRLMSTLAYLEASIDFSEDEIPSEDIAQPLTLSLQGLDAIRTQAARGLIYRDGTRVALVGRPNMGKSSLLNALLRAPRAIVTDVPGTTRDTVEESVVIQGIPMVLVDTAGLREAVDEVERIGVDRAKQALSSADVRLIVVDGSRSLEEQDQRLIRDLADATTIVVQNKSDLGPSDTDDLSMALVRSVRVSALTGDGISELESRLADLVTQGVSARSDEDVVLAVPRHVESLQVAIEAINRCLRADAAGASVDLIAGELALGVRALGEITGENASEDLLDMIFSRFCLGK